MIFESAFHVEKVASPDFTRGLMHHAYFDPSKKRLMATNGHALAIVPVRVEDGDTEGPVTGEAMKAARKAAGKHGDPAIALNGHQAIPTGPTFPRPTMDGRTYPPIDDVIPAYSKGTDGTVTIGLNVNLLAMLASAIGVSAKTGIIEITIKLPSPDDKGLMRNPMIVKTDVNPDAIGILMPCRIK